MNTLRKKLYTIIFKTDTKAGKLFDVILLIIILINILAVMLESVVSINVKYGEYLEYLEWIITGIFTLEYLLRIWISKKPLKYIFSFYGIIDFLSILPTFMEVIFVGSHSFAIIRSLRLLRLFRVFKLTRYMHQGNIIIQALRDSWAKISVFLFGVITIILVIGTAMYMVEGPEHGFSSIPQGVYWTIVTVTTVGYGDIIPQTTIGQFIASFTMILGYAIIAVPTGIVTVEMGKRKDKKRTCPHCNATNLDKDAKFCQNCGKPLSDDIV